MAEVYPSDATLLALTSEALSGVEYIVTGKAPYYLEFRKLIYRLLMATVRANDLRVFDEGSLNIGVKAGKFWDGSTLRTYAGSTGNALADSKTHIYVYINSAGTLVINEYTAWPSAYINHIRLADITTAGGDITSIVDARDHHILTCPMGAITPDVADGANGIPIIIQKTFPDGATGDVEIYNANAPFKFRVINAWVENRAANGANANTVQVCAAASGASPITDAMSLNNKADKDVVRCATLDDSTGTISANGSLYLRVTRAGGAVGGNVYIEVLRVA